MLRIVSNYKFMARIYLFRNCTRVCTVCRSRA